MEPLTLTLIVAVVALVIAVPIVNVVRNRPFTEETEIYRASRWTGGNHVWPTQIAVLPSSVVRHTPKLLGSIEETISIDQVASVSLNSGLFFADVIIETTGGSRPILCNGHWKKDAQAIRDKIAAAKAARDVRPQTASAPPAPPRS